MFKLKIALAALLAAAALSAAAADSASADWYVGGTKLATTAAVASKLHIDRLLGFRVPFTARTVTCTGNATTLLEIAGAIIIAETHPLLGSIVLAALIVEHCTVVGGGKCSIAKEKITTEPLVGQISNGPGKEDRLIFTPKTGKLIATISFEGSECALAGEQPLEGSFTMKLPTGEEEDTDQALEGLSTTENNSLELAKSKTYVEGGDIQLELASTSKWSDH
jgi:hypothetical protein